MGASDPFFGDGLKGRVYGKAMNVIKTLKEQMGLNGQELNIHVVQLKNRREAIAQVHNPSGLSGSRVKRRKLIVSRT